MRTVIVDVRNDILGNSEFWRGPEDRIEEIRNIPARMCALRVVASGQPSHTGMWYVRIEEQPHDSQD